MFAVRRRENIGPIAGALCAIAAATAVQAAALPGQETRTDRETLGDKLCEQRLRAFDAALAAARTATRGQTRLRPPSYVGVEPFVADRGWPLDLKSLVVGVGKEAIWLDDRRMPANTQSGRLTELLAEIAQLRANYELLRHEKPARTQLLTFFDRGLTARDVQAVIAVLGREHSVIPLVLTAPPPSSDPKALKARLERVVATESMGWDGSRCPLPDLTPPGPAPGGAYPTEDELLAYQHQRIIDAVRACSCRGPDDLDLMKDQLLWKAGALGPAVRRLPFELAADAGTPVDLDPAAPFVAALTKLASGPHPPEGRLVIRLKRTTGAGKPRH